MTNKYLYLITLLSFSISIINGMESPDGHTKFSNLPVVIRRIIGEYLPNEWMPVQEKKIKAYRLLVSKDESTIVTGYGNEITIMDKFYNEKLKIEEPNGFWIRSMAISPNGEALAVGFDSHHCRNCQMDPRIDIWDPKLYCLIASLPSYDNGGISAIKFSDEGKYMVSTDKGGLVNIYDTSSWKRIQQYQIASNKLNLKDTHHYTDYNKYHENTYQEQISISFKYPHLIIMELMSDKRGIAITNIDMQQASCKTSTFDGRLHGNYSGLILMPEGGSLALLYNIDEDQLSTDDNGGASGLIKILDFQSNRRAISLKTRPFSSVNPYDLRMSLSYPYFLVSEARLSEKGLGLYEKVRVSAYNLETKELIQQQSLDEKVIYGLEFLANNNKILLLSSEKLVESRNQALAIDL